MKEVISPREEIFEEWRKKTGFFLGPLVFLLILFLPFGALSPQAHRLAAILGLVIIYWLTEAIPIPVTALLGAALAIVLGVADAKTVLSPFANPIIFLFIGSFLIAHAMSLHGLDRRIALRMLSLRWVGRSPVRILIVLGCICAFISMWVSNTATCAMLFPIALGILHATKGDTDNNYSVGMMLMVAYAASIGGIGTPIGTPPNLIGLGMMREIMGVDIPFFRWMSFAVPILIVMFLVLSFLIFRLHPLKDGFKKLNGLDSYLKLKVKELGAWTPGERNVLICFLLAVTLWISPGFLAIFDGTEGRFYRWYSAHLPEEVIGLLASILLFFLPVSWKEKRFTLEWREAVKIDWGTILLFGGGLSLGSLMFSTKLAEVVGQNLANLTHAKTLWTITALAIGFSILISELTSNTASASLVIPVMLGISQSAGVNPIPPALGACLGASFGFMLPVSTPPNAIVYGSGLVPIMKMVRAGIIFDICGFVTIWLGLRLLFAFGWLTFP